MVCIYSKNNSPRLPLWCLWQYCNSCNCIPGKGEYGNILRNSGHNVQVNIDTWGPEASRWWVFTLSLFMLERSMDTCWLWTSPVTCFNRWNVAGTTPYQLCTYMLRRLCSYCMLVNPSHVGSGLLGTIISGATPVSALDFLTSGFQWGQSIKW